MTRQSHPCSRPNPTYSLASPLLPYRRAFQRLPRSCLIPVTMSFYHNLNKEHSYHRGVFLAVSLLTAGLCSLYPMMCFKHHSSKERKRKKMELSKVDQRIEEAEEELAGVARRGRWREHSLPRTARTPRSHQRRRHSSAGDRGHHDHRSRRYREDDREESRSQRGRMGHSRHAYDQQLDSERRDRHSGRAPPRKYHHSSWEGVLGPMPTF